MRFIIILILLYCIPINGQVMLQGNNIISEEGSYFISLPKIRICDNDVQEIVKAYIPIINPTLTLRTFFKNSALDFQPVSIREASKPLCRAQGFERDFVPLHP